MLNGQGVVPALTIRVRPRGAHFRFSLNQVTAFVWRAARAAAGWARIPLMPYATLWEASLWISRTDRCDGCCEPDVFASESPLFRECWPFA
jgi:hypothetical protein